MQQRRQDKEGGKVGGGELSKRWKRIKSRHARAFLICICVRDCLCVCGKGWQTASSALVSGVWCPYPQAVASGTGNGARGFCFVGHVASEKNFNFPSFHFRSGFRRRRCRLVCVAHITHTQRARQGATGSRKCCLPLGALPNRALACSLSLSMSLPSFLRVAF